MEAMLQRTWGRLGSTDTSAPFLPLSFRFFASFGLLVVHAALPVEGRTTAPGEAAYLLILCAMFAESIWETARGLQGADRLFPTPRPAWIRWNLAMDLVLVSSVIAFQGVMQERFATLYIFPVLASAFYLGTAEIVWIGIAASLTHVCLVLGFTTGLFPPFGLSEALVDPDPNQVSFLLGIASLQVFATTLLVVFIRRNLDRLSSDLSLSEATVDELSALHQRVVQSMNSGLITLDHDGRVTTANPAAEVILGVRVQPGTPIQDLLPLTDPLPKYQGREHRFEVAIPDPKRGRRLLGGHLASLRGATGSQSGQLLLFQDLTELKALEERTRISERLAAIGQLAAGLAHELRNPLASISGCVQLLQREEAPKGVSSRVLGILERETQRVGAIVTDFLDLARPAALSEAVVFLPRMIEEVRSSWEMDPRIGGLQLVVDAAPPVWFRSDPTGLHRILMNLLSNARKAVKGLSNARIQISFEVDQETLCLAITDNGCGMTPEQLDRLFVPFAGSFEEGSGLGMSLVYKFIEAMGWRIEVQSQAGQGTRIQIRMPRRSDDGAMALGPPEA
jgi:two-component system sensor histidine kinase PilS (NtrC family)